MKLGLILECQLDGPDEKVLTCLFRRFATHIQPEFVQLGDKLEVLHGCGTAARRLFAAGCEHIVIMWDFCPADWGGALAQKGVAPCLLKDCRRVFRSLEAADVSREQISLVAVNFMLESWLLADKQAIRNFLERQTRQTIKSQKIGSDKPERCPEPKVTLNTIFKRCGYRRYLDYNDAHLIAQEIKNLDVVREQCPTFDRFWEKATGIT